jgi:hypothetical protein
MITLLVEDDRDLAANIGEFLELLGTAWTTQPTA